MPRQKAYNRDQVLEKAMTLFWNQGYSTTSIRELEKEMGINQFSIYAEFKSKEGVFIAALKRYMELNKAVILKGLVASQGDLDDIKIFFKGFVKSVKSGKTPNGCFFANTAIEIKPSNIEVHQQLKGFFKLLKGVYLSVLEKAQANGTLTQKAQTTKLANYLVGVTEGLAVTAKVLKPAELNDFIEVALDALKSH